MTDWQFTIDLEEVWASNDVVKISDKIASELGRILPEIEFHREEEEATELKNAFQYLAQPSEIIDAALNRNTKFNIYMEQLYNWADRNSVWVATLF